MNAYKSLRDRLSTIVDIAHSVGMLHWDTEVNMPEKGAAKRAQQISTLSGIAHDMFVSPETRALIDSSSSENSISDSERRNVELIARDFDKESKLPTEFVKELSRAQSIAYVEWVKSRRQQAFSSFAPSLKTLVDLKRKEADLRGFTSEPYDALLDTYEPGLKAAWLDEVFSAAKEGMLPLLEQINSKPVPDTGFFTKHYDKDKQWQFGLDLLAGIGYDFQRGRQDLSPHPFTIGLHPNDVRVTTHVNEHDFRSMTWSCLHEGGHALYEQGLNPDSYGVPEGSAASLAIHESQSRLWENHVGRSRAFWEFWYPKLQAVFPENLSGVSLDAFYLGMNAIRPDLIRIEADELHYHLHVIIRFEIERAVINGELDVDQMPSEWNRRYKEYLNVEVPHDGDGVLQDVHWSHGSFGYFPTYSLGSFYAAQFYHTASEAIPGLEDDSRQGNHDSLLTWLNEHIHKHGRLLDPADLCRSVTGEELNVEFFLKYARDKFGEIYELGA